MNKWNVNILLWREIQEQKKHVYNWFSIFYFLLIFSTLPAFVKAKRPQRVENDCFDDDSSSLLDVQVQFGRQIA